MGKKQKPDSKGIVFSSNPLVQNIDLSGILSNVKLSEDKTPLSTEESSQQTSSNKPTYKDIVRVTKEKFKADKIGTRIVGLQLSEDKLDQLCKTLKQKCGVGGSAKDHEILLQGDHVEKVIKILIDLGYKNTKRSGG